MLTPRFGSPLALIHQRFILTLGGFTTKGDQTTECEAYDTVTNHWFHTVPLPFQVANTTAVVMSNRYVYLMPGKQTKSKTLPPLLRICVLDCGDISSFRGDLDSQQYGYSLQQKSWGYLDVANPEFIKSFPVAGI